MFLLLLAVVLASGCAGHATGPWDPGIEAAYYDDDPTPDITNDGFYDGGVFDQDEINREPGKPQ